MNHFLTPFPESDEVLSLYYALQDAGIPCVIVRHSVDPKLIKVTPEQNPDSEHIAQIKGFIAGWSACYYREALPSDTSLQPTPGQIGR